MRTSTLYFDQPADWQISPGLTPYPLAVETMVARARAIIEGSADELVWLVEHPPLYSAGTSAKPSDLVTPERFDVFKSGRGGQYTYHGPGQRVAYVMLDLRKRGRDVSAFVRTLEQWIIDTLAEFDVKGVRRSDRVGVWTDLPGGNEAKIAAIGVRLKKWVSFHGIAINLTPELEHFSGIVPCGISDYGVTSLKDLGISANMAQLDNHLKTHFQRLFGPVKSQ